MNKKTRIIKDVLKCGEEKPTFGTNPNDPWSTKANISESALLNRYLKSRGINPQYASKDLKVAHSKTKAFQVWATAHVNDPVQESVDKRDVVAFDIPLLIRMLEYAREDAKTDMDLHKVVEKLIQIRNKGVLTMKDYKYVTSIREELEKSGMELNELTKILDRYKEKAGKEASAADKSGDVKKANKRFSGIMKATRKQFDNDAKKVEEATYHGSTAATQMPFDGANNPEDTIPAKNKNTNICLVFGRAIFTVIKLR